MNTMRTKSELKFGILKILMRWLLADRVFCIALLFVRFVVRNTVL